MHHRSALDLDLVEELMQAELDRDNALLEYARSGTQNPVRRLYESLASFDYNVARELAIREQARRDGVMHDERYDRSLLAAEAAVIDVCEQIISAENEDPLLGSYVAGERLARGLALVGQERDLALKTGWAHRKHRKTLALREVAWQKAIHFARKRGALRDSRA
jgi:hypothetical protein